MKIHSPLGIPVQSRFEARVRPEGLKGLRIGLLDNQKAPVDRILLHLEQRLQERYPGVSFVSRSKKMTGHPAAPEIIGQLTEGCDVVINALGD